MGIKNTETYKLDGQSHEMYYNLGKVNTDNQENIMVSFDKFLSKDVSDKLKKQFKETKGRLVNTGAKNIPNLRIGQQTLTVERYSNELNKNENDPKSFTVDFANNKIQKVAHGLENFDIVIFKDHGSVGLKDNTFYYVINKTDDNFEVSESFENPVAVNIQADVPDNAVYHKVEKVENQLHRSIVNAIASLVYTELKSQYPDLFENAVDC